jgi:50S ribosomal subunit-associated GTPase HflX
MGNRIKWARWRVDELLSHLETPKTMKELEKLMNLVNYSVLAIIKQAKEKSVIYTVRAGKETTYEKHPKV